MSVFKPGDKVSVLKDTIRGVVIHVDHFQITIEDEDGFTRKYPSKSLVLLKDPKEYKIFSDAHQKLIEDTVAKKLSKAHRPTQIHEIDLHIETLVDDHSGWQNHEILQKQMNVCRNFVRKAINEHRKRIVLIHGKGEGVLKSEILVYLNKLKHQDGYQLEYHEADYSEYGMGGATEVIFHTF